ncbi:MAG: ABC transporter permease [Lachnospiraceae bacterium]|nr:ABC transporter permease [Lachnospiraceae bacterium]
MKQLGKRGITMIVTLVVVSFLVFLAFDVIPGDAATSKLGTQATPERVEALREEMGLNRPFLVRYGTWLAGFVKGDMGTSYSYSRPVKGMVADKVPITVTLMVLAFILVVAISIPLGIYAARYQGRFLDRLIGVIDQIIMAVPPFFSGIIITVLFGVLLKWFTPGGFVSYTKNWGAFLGYMIFPAIAIALPKIAMAVKLLRTSILEEIGKDYVRTAYSRGNKTKQVLYRHVLKNALIPVITFLGMALSDMVAGSIIIEQVFNIPGLGRILLTSISNRDYPVVEAIIMLIAALVIIVNFVVDALYRVIDPRMRRS